MQSFLYRICSFHEPSEELPQLKATRVLWNLLMKPNSSHGPCLWSADKPPIREQRGAARLPRGLPIDHTTKFKGMTKLPGERKVCNAFHREEKTKKLRRDETREKQSHQLVAHVTTEQEGHPGVRSLCENGLRAYSMPAMCQWIFPKNKTGRPAMDTRRG